MGWNKLLLSLLSCKIIVCGSKEWAYFTGFINCKTKTWQILCEWWGWKTGKIKWSGSFFISPKCCRKSEFLWNIDYPEVKKKSSVEKCHNYFFLLKKKYFRESCIHAREKVSELFFRFRCALVLKICVFFFLHW